MSQDPEDIPNLPIACTLTPAELAAGWDELLPGLVARANATEPVPGGVRWRFEPEAGLVQDIAAVIEAEHRCCRFLRFQLILEPGDGPVWLEVTGPEGTQDFLSMLSASALP